jgi:hypothetical protein
MTPERITAPKRQHSIAVRAARLIDGLIDQAHRDCPGTCFVLRLPSGEQVFIPAHTSGGPRCPTGHAGYFRDRIRPFCEVDPTVRAGLCSMTPLALDRDPRTAPVYQVDLRSGAVTSTIHLPAPASGQQAGPLGGG